MTLWPLSLLNSSPLMRFVSTPPQLSILMLRCCKSKSLSIPLFDYCLSSSSSLIEIPWLQPCFNPLRNADPLALSMFHSSSSPHSLSSSSSLESLVHHCDQSFVHIHNSIATFFLHHLPEKTPILFKVNSLPVLSLYPSSGTNLVKTVITCAIWI